MKDSRVLTWKRLAVLKAQRASLFSVLDGSKTDPFSISMEETRPAEHRSVSSPASCDTAGCATTSQVTRIAPKTRRNVMKMALYTTGEDTGSRKPTRSTERGARTDGPFEFEATIL